MLYIQNNKLKKIYIQNNKLKKFIFYVIINKLKKKVLCKKYQSKKNNFQNNEQKFVNAKKKLNKNYKYK